MEVERDQHFMTDRKILGRMVSLAGIRKGEPVLEIGPGTGNLTEGLAKSGGKVTSIEIDPLLEGQLKRRLKGHGNVRVLIGNGLDHVRKQDKLDKIVSNLPYAICEPLFQNLLFKDFERAVLTVPKGFWERISPRGKSVLSFYCSVFLEARKALDVPREAFLPRPKTDSVVIVLARKEPGLLQAVLKKQSSLLKNALREALCGVEGLTKNQAREKSGKFRLGSLLDKKVRDLDLKELLSLKRMLE